MPKIRGVTGATIFTAACALTISRITDSNDILFGRLVGGRASLPSGLRDVVFHCITSLPVQIRVEEGKGEEIVRQVERQYERGLAYEHGGLEDIAANCADWPADTYEFGVLAQYQNLEEDIAGEEAANREGKEKWEAHSIRSVGDHLARSNTVVVAGVPNGEELGFAVIAKETVCDEDVLEKILGALRSVLAELDDRA